MGFIRSFEAYFLRLKSIFPLKSSFSNKLCMVIASAWLLMALFFLSFSVIFSHFSKEKKVGDIDFF